VRTMSITGKTLQLGATVLFSGLFLAGVGLAQAPPGPIAPTEPPPGYNAAPPPKPVQVTPRKNMMGAWKLNRDESDDPRQKLQQAHSNSGQNGGNSGGSRVGIGGWPGGGMGGGGMGGGPHRPQGGESDADRAALQDLFTPDQRLSVSQHMDKDPEIDITGDQDRKRALFTDGRKLDKPKDTGTSYQEIAARWDDNKLVTDEVGPKKGKVSRTYELSPDGLQLWETIHSTDSKGNKPMTVRFVYDIAQENARM
jgi:hypothetical protein